MRTAIVMSLGLLLLTSCVSAQQQAAMRAQEVEHQRQQAEAIRTGIQNQCAGYGFRPGTDAFAGCVQNEYHKREDDVRRAVHAQQQQRVNAASYQCSRGIQQACWDLRNLRGY
ncbi:MAG: hypothetical protein QOK44_4258 [Betaproteobacteria bacterium]|jgi:hypothetical protein|nr:hypothetical protein [Betaproteobacteria bacterium]